MFRRCVGGLLMCALLVLGASCVRMGGPGQNEKVLGIERLTKLDSIPAEWGKLVSVNSSPGLDYLAQIWFQDDAGVIRMIHYNVRDNFLTDQVRVIGRD